MPSEGGRRRVVETTVVGNDSPVAVDRASRSSTAVSDSRPSSRNGRSAVTAAADGRSSTAATCSRTRSSSGRARRAAGATGTGAGGVTDLRFSMSGRGRASVYDAANRSQSTSATTRVAAPDSTHRRIASNAVGVPSGTDRPGAGSAPPVRHAATRPRPPGDRRRSEVPGATALGEGVQVGVGGGVPAWPALPQVPATDGRARTRPARRRRAARRAGRRRPPWRPGVRQHVETRVGERVGRLVPAVCTTAVGGWSRSRPARTPGR
ncbi:hypothetical protein NKG94_04070 [Micromonospora sp. M12]